MSQKKDSYKPVSGAERRIISHGEIPVTPVFRRKTGR